MLAIVLLGPPGAGKGTQAALMIDKWSLPHISTGDMFRRAISDGTPMGKKARGYIDQGLLVPDEIVIALVEERLASSDCSEGFILDGFPRTVVQAEAFDLMLARSNRELNAVLSFEVPEDHLLHRLSGRRVCRTCGALYHVDALSGSLSCPKDAGELYQRPDDAMEAVSVRLKTFVLQTKPLKQYYSEKKKLFEINGLGDPLDVFRRVKEVVGRN